MLTMSRVQTLLMTLAGCLFALPLSAAVQLVGSNCAVLPAGTANFTVTYTGAVPANRGVMATLVTSQNAPLAVTVLDTQGNQYPGSITRFNDPGLVFNRIAQIVTPVPIGSVVTFPFSSIPPGGMHACAQLLASTDMFIPTATGPVDGMAGASQNISVSLPSPTTNPLEVIHASAFTLGDPGVITTDPNFVNHVKICSTSNIICLLTATREVSGTGIYTYTAGLATSRVWGAVIAPYRRIVPDPIFGNGFE